MVYDYGRSPQFYVSVGPHDRDTTTSSTATNNGNRLLIYEYHHHNCMIDMMIPWHADGFSTIFRQRDTPTTWLNPPFVQQSPTCDIPLHTSFGSSRSCDIVAITDDIMGVMVHHHRGTGSEQRSRHTLVAYLFFYSIRSNAWLNRGGTKVVFQRDLTVVNMVVAHDRSDGTGYHHVQHHQQR